MGLGNLIGMMASEIMPGVVSLFRYVFIYHFNIFNNSFMGTDAVLTDEFQPAADDG